MPLSKPRTDKYMYPIQYDSIPWTAPFHTIISQSAYLILSRLQPGLLRSAAATLLLYPQGVFDQHQPDSTADMNTRRIHTTQAIETEQILGEQNRPYLPFVSATSFLRS